MKSETQSIRVVAQALATRSGERQVIVRYRHGPTVIHSAWVLKATPLEEDEGREVEAFEPVVWRERLFDVART